MLFSSFLWASFAYISHFLFWIKRTNKHHIFAVRGLNRKRIFPNLTCDSQAAKNIDFLFTFDTLKKNIGFVCRFLLFNEIKLNTCKRLRIKDDGIQMTWLRINLIFYFILYAVPHSVVFIAFISVYPIIRSNYGSSDLCCLRSQFSLISLPFPITPKTLNITYLNFLNLIVADNWQSLTFYAYAVCAALCLLQFSVPWPNNFRSALVIGRIV